MSRQSLAYAALTAVVALAGCGGSGSRPSAADNAFKRAVGPQLVQVHVVGGQLTSALAAEPQMSDALAKRTFTQLVDAAKPLVDGLGGLRPPSRYRADVETMRSGLEHARSDLHAIALAAAHHDAAARAQALAAVKVDSVPIKAADARVTKALGLPGA